MLLNDKFILTNKFFKIKITYIKLEQNIKFYICLHFTFYIYFLLPEIINSRAFIKMF